jgi:hypothetical protein
MHGLTCGGAVNSNVIRGARAAFRASMGNSKWRNFCKQSIWCSVSTGSSRGIHRAVEPPANQSLRSSTCDLLASW